MKLLQSEQQHSFFFKKRIKLHIAQHLKDSLIEKIHTHTGIGVCIKIKSQI